MEINLNDLKTAVKRVLAGTGNSSTHEGAENLIFSAGAVHSYNGNISVSVPLFDMESRPFALTGTLHGKKLAAVLAKLKGDTVDIEADDQGAWTITHATGTVEPTMFQDTLSTDIAALNLDKLTWTSLPDDFLSALALVYLDNHKFQQPYLLVSEVKGEDDGVLGSWMLARDFFRYNAYRLDGMDEFLALHGGFALQSADVRELLSVPDLSEIAVSGNWVHFLTHSGAVLSMKRLAYEGDYPVDQHVAAILSHGSEDNCVTYDVGLPSGLADAVGRVSVFGSQDTASGFLSIACRVTGQNLQLSAKVKEGKAKETLPLDEALPEETDVLFSTSAYFLQEAATKGVRMLVKVFTRMKDGVETKIPGVWFRSDRYVQIAKAMSA